MVEGFEGDADEWAASVLNRIRLHRRRDLSGTLSMMDSDLLDVFDALAVAPLLLAEETRRAEMAGFERRRLAWLDTQLSTDFDKGEVDAATPPRKSAL